MVLSAFRYPADTLAFPPKLFFEISLDGFEKVFRQTTFGLYLLNSLFITAFSVAITMLVATPAAYALVRISRGGTAFLLTVLIARMIPAIALVVPIYIIGNLTRQLDTYQIMIVVTVAFNLPFAIWMVRGFFLDLPANLVDAARIDGATRMAGPDPGRGAAGAGRDLRDGGFCVRRCLERVSVRPHPDKRKNNHRDGCIAQLPHVSRDRVGHDQRRRLHGFAAGDRLRFHHAALSRRGADDGRRQISARSQRGNMADVQLKKSARIMPLST